MGLNNFYWLILMVITTHSKSLYNISQSKGWTEEENKVLKLSLMKFGVGNWTIITRLGLLPGKNITQINLQTQRILGQQSLGGFMNIKLNPEKIRHDNEENAKNDPNITVKSGLIINTGENPTKKSREDLVERNQKKYGLSEEELQKISDDDLYSIKRKRRIDFNEQMEKYLEEKKKEKVKDIEEKEVVENLSKKIKESRKRESKLQQTLYQNLTGKDTEDDFPFDIINDEPSQKKKKK